MYASCEHFFFCCLVLSCSISFRAVSFYVLCSIVVLAGDEHSATFRGRRRLRDPRETIRTQLRRKRRFSCPPPLPTDSVSEKPSKKRGIFPSSELRTQSFSSFLKSRGIIRILFRSISGKQQCNNKYYVIYNEFQANNLNSISDKLQGKALLRSVCTILQRNAPSDCVVTAAILAQVTNLTRVRIWSREKKRKKTSEKCEGK